MWVLRPDMSLVNIYGARQIEVAQEEGGTTLYATVCGYGLPPSTRIALARLGYDESDHQGKIQTFYAALLTALANGERLLDLAAVASGLCHTGKRVYAVEEIRQMSGWRGVRDLVDE